MDFDYGVLYVIQKFEEHLEEKEFKDAFVHVTCATDTNNMNFVLNSVRSMLIDGRGELVEAGTVYHWTLFVLKNNCK